MKEVFKELCELCNKYNIEIIFNGYGFIIRKFEEDKMFNKMHSLQSFEYLHESISLEDIVVDFINEWEANK